MYKRLVMVSMLFLGIVNASYAIEKNKLNVFFSVEKNEIKLKWISANFSTNNTYKIYRSDKDNPKKLIASTRMIDYTTLVKSNRYVKDDFEFFYPYKYAKTLDDKLKIKKQQTMLAGFRVLRVLKNNYFAKDMGQFFIDKSIKRNTRYTYTIELLRNGEISDSVMITINSSKKYLHSGIFFVTAKNKATGVELKWGVSGQYGFYNIYRKLKKKGAYTKINKDPIYISPYFSKNAKSFYEDRKLKINKKAYYRITKINMFGLEGIPSYEVSGVKLGLKIKPIVKNIFISNSDKKMTIRWGKIPNVLGYNVYRSNNNVSGFVKLNTKPIKKGVYFDKKFTTNQDYYYYVTSINKMGESKPSIKLLTNSRDVTVPSFPKNLSSQVQAGIVKLKWKMVKDHDLLGYRVYMSMDEDLESWSLLTKKAIQENTYNHRRSKSLSRNFYFYRVTAIDKSLNESAPSNHLKVKLPDVIPPGQPVISQFFSYPSKVKLIWKESQVYDFAYYNIYNYQGKKLNKKPLLNTQFIDLKPTSGINEYFITAVDKSANESLKTKSVKVNIVDLKPVKIDDFSIVKVKNGIKIGFVSKDKDYNGFEVFRSTGKNVNYYNISGFLNNKLNFVDKNIKKDTVFLYMIKAYDKTGNMSKSKVLSLKL